ncbi:hypothetical protein M885DRAFT_623976 [Pelagophyceae sp. CCMP2097]|nr:hypothetical protein M885DRAFT_623976 [Pelagophyceae sp. CCMP2097]
MFLLLLWLSRSAGLVARRPRRPSARRGSTPSPSKGSAATEDSAGVNSERHFVVAFHDDAGLCDERFDVLCGCATAALWLAGGARRDTTVWFQLGSSSVGVHGAALGCADEGALSLLLRDALLQDVPPPGFVVRRGDSLTSLVGRLAAGAAVVIVDAAGADADAVSWRRRRGPAAGAVRGAGGGRASTRVVVIVAGGASPALAELRAAHPAAETVSLGPEKLLAAQAITVVHNGLDRADAALAAAELERTAELARGRVRTRLFKSEARLNTLQACAPDSDAYRRLASKGDPYDAALFGQPHVDFKRRHNVAFATLAKLVCGDDLDARKPRRRRKKRSSDDGASAVFYLEGADGATSRALADAGFACGRLVVANPFPETCAALRVAGLSDVFEARAEEYLATTARTFGALYLDGCGGAAGPLVAMARYVDQSPSLPDAFAVGFTLTAAEPSGTPVGEREQGVVAAWAAAARRRGFGVRRAFDDAAAYGLDASTPKCHEATLTSWLVFSKHDRGH